MKYSCIKYIVFIFFLYAVSIFNVGLFDNYDLLINNAYASKQAFQEKKEDGLRDCFLSFQENMTKYKRGDTKNTDKILNLMQLPASIDNSEKYSYLLNKANQLFFVLKNINFDYYKDIPGTPKDDNISFELYMEDGTPITFYMTKNKSNKWIFAAKTLDSPEIKKIYHDIYTREQKLTRVDMEGETFDPNLMSPYRTMLTLRAGVMGLYGMNLNDAAKTLDFSEFEPALIGSLGETLAVRLYRILHFESPLNPEELSANPLTENIPVFLVEPGFGVITMQVVEDENGIKAWKFTPKSLDVVIETYDKNISDILSKGDDPFIGNDLPFDVIVDDFFQGHFSYLEEEIAGIDIWKYMIFIILILINPFLIWLIKIFSHVVMRFIRNRASKSLGQVSDQKLFFPLTFVSLAFLWTEAFIFLITSEKGAAFLLIILNVILIIGEVWIVTTIISLAIKYISGKFTSKSSATSILVVGQILTAIIVVVGIIKIAAIFGQDSTRVLAALGIGGVAIALAGKNTVENIFGTMMIVTTHPFGIGDYIVVNNIKGIVEHVGLRSTLIRTFHNSLVTVPNSHFITSPVDNMGKRTHRKFNTTIGIAYDTPPEKIICFVEGLREFARQNPLIDDSRQYIYLNDFGPSSLDILLVLHLQVSGREEELEVRERYILNTINLADSLSIEFAFPTRTLYMRKEETPVHESLEGEKRAKYLGREAASLLLNKQKEES